MRVATRRGLLHDEGCSTMRAAPRRGLRHDNGSERGSTDKEGARQHERWRQHEQRWAGCGTVSQTRRAAWMRAATRTVVVGWTREATQTRGVAQSHRPGGWCEQGGWRTRGSMDKGGDTTRVVREVAQTRRAPGSTNDDSGTNGGGLAAAQTWRAKWMRAAT